MDHVTGICLCVQHSMCVWGGCLWVTEPQWIRMHARVSERGSARVQQDREVERKRAEKETGETQLCGGRRCWSKSQSSIFSQGFHTGFQIFPSDGGSPLMVHRTLLCSKKRTQTGEGALPLTPFVPTLLTDGTGTMISDSHPESSRWCPHWGNVSNLSLEKKKNRKAACSCVLLHRFPWMCLSDCPEGISTLERELEWLLRQCQEGCGVFRESLEVLWAQSPPHQHLVRVDFFNTASLLGLFMGDISLPVIEVHRVVQSQREQL